MKIKLIVNVDGIHFNGEAAVDIPELLVEQFKPCKFCDDPIIAMATGDIMEHELIKVMKIRDDTANILAKHLSKMIFAQMRKHDTFNGYPKDGESL